MTSDAPKCLVPIHDGRSLLEFQLRALARCGIDRAVVMVGYGADCVEAALADLPLPNLEVTTRYNPFASTSDNLVTAWLASAEMNEDFLLLNGDTLFDDRILQGLLAAASGPATMAMAHKRSYDDDDMKVVLEADGRLQAIGKALPGLVPDGEAIGMTLFRGEGPLRFREVLDEIVRTPEGLRAWYTSALDGLCDRVRVQPVSIGDAWWAEIDTENDLFAVRDALRSRGTRRDEAAPGAHAAASVA